MSKKELELKINSDAFDMFLYMRDYKPDEVTMFGLTYPQDPLHVYEFALVKQKVNSVSSDCDENYMADFVANNVDKGIMPINCERVWCHTHPMTGANSANPSGKDMATWNDKDNALKNFMIMMILSRSGEITCKLRIRSNLSNEVPGLDYPFEVEKDIPVKIVPSPAKEELVKATLITKFGEQAVTALGDKAISALGPYVSIKDIYPNKIKDLEEQYEKLVSKDTPIVVRGHTTNWQQYNHNQSSSKKKEKKTASERTVPEMLLRISEHKTDFKILDDKDRMFLGDNFTGTLTYEALNNYFDLFESETDTGHTNSVVAMLLGAISANIVDMAGSRMIVTYKSEDIERRCTAVSSARLVYPTFKKLAAYFNTDNKVGEI